MSIALFTTFRGRIGRLHWWVGNLILLAAQFLVGILFGIGLMGAGYDLDDPVAAGNIVDGITLVTGLVFLLPTWALVAKRLHDRDKSVKWILLFLVPVLGWLWLLVELGFLHGTVGPNRFGADPVAM